MSSVSTSQPSGPLRPRRYKAAIACTTCRRRKLKCDGLHPACGRCQKSLSLRETCTYIPISANRGSPLSFSAQPVSSSPNLPTPATSTVPRFDQSGYAESIDAFSEDDANNFASTVKDTINAKLGLPSNKKRCPIPLTDAPMFGVLAFPLPLDDDLNQADNVLPPRKQADDLVGLYWRNLEPLEPILDERRFSLSYQSLFVGGEVGGDEHVFLSTLNLIFAISVQIQESLPSDRREEASKVFFVRAWRLLRPETIVWGTPSLELVQCLLLMVQYLQCTRNLHQTWMALVSAVRIAQSLGLHVADETTRPFEGDAWLRQQIWQRCVSLVRSLSWSLGQSPMTQLINTPGSKAFLQNMKTLSDLHPAFISAKVMELDEITGYILTSQLSAEGQFGESLGLPPLSHNADAMTTVRIDERLTQLEKSVPSPAMSNAVVSHTANLHEGQLLMLHLRIAQTRIILCRPMLARFSLARTQGSGFSNSGLGDRILQSCAALCMESAQRMIALVQDSSRPGQAVGILPWWYRVYFLYIALQHLVAAALRPDVFAPAVLETWATGMVILSAHEHLSQSVTRCITKFRMMWDKVTAVNTPGGSHGSQPIGPSEQSIQDVFHLLGLDNEFPLFGLDNSAWLETSDWVFEQ